MTRALCWEVFAGWRVAVLLPLLVATLACGDRPEVRPPPDKAEAESGQETTAVRPGRSTRPNLVLITLDTTRADALGAYGQPRPTSPSIDRLAGEGVLFEQTNTTNPETLPAHASLFTGKWPLTHGVRANAGHVLAARHTTLAEVLKASGYRTGAEIAAQVLRSATGITQGFDQIRDASSDGVELERIQNRGVTQSIPMRTGADITKLGIEFLDQGEGPFFLWLHYFDAHDPYRPPAAMRQKISDSDYHAEVAGADAAIGRFVEALERRGLRGDTHLVVTADHGEGLAEHDEPTHSYFIYESTMRVPWIMSGPGLQRGVRIPDPVRLLDVMPTVLELLAIEVPSDVEGVSLAPRLRGVGAVPSLESYGEASRFGAVLDLPMLRSYREGNWKYIHKVNPELYDLEADPAETDNRFSAEPEVGERLRSKLARLVEGADPSSDARVAVDADTSAQLAALGYATRPGEAPEADDPMALWGDDPATKIGDTRLLSEATGLLDREEWAEAWKRVKPVRQRNPESAYVLEMAARNLIALERIDESIEAMQRLLEKQPCGVFALERLPAQLRAKKRYAELVATHATAYEHCPELFENLNNYAWVLATLPVDELRDGARAVALLEPAIAAQPNLDPSALDTLAAAKAEAGDFAGAIATQQKALAKLRANRAHPALIQLLETHLAEFEAGRPIREP